MGNLSAKYNGTIYVVGNNVNNLVKIGFTGGDVVQRVRNIQNMSPVELTTLLTTKGSSYMERGLHYFLYKNRKHGEWFDFGDDDPVRTVAEAIRIISDKYPILSRDVMWGSSKLALEQLHLMQSAGV